LFTTEDGVDVYEGDIVYSLETDRKSRRKYKVCSVLESTTDKVPGCISSDGFNALFPQDGDKIFSTPEAAEEYILLNKPCLSMKDVIDYMYECTIFDTKNTNDYPLLRKLVESKLC